MAFLTGLHTRGRIPELMDDPALDPAEHRRALAGLARLNWVANSAGTVWPAIRDLARKLGRPVRVLDVATGGGDFPAKLLAKAKRSGVGLEVTGCDISPTAIAEARAAHPGIEFFLHDAIRDRLPTGFDVATSSLFLHHLGADDEVALFANMEHAARHLILVTDLARSRFNYCAVWAACHLLTTSRVVRFDGPASVRSAFTPAEAVAVADRAGLHGATTRSAFPARYLLTWERR